MASDIILYFNLFIALFLNGVISFPSSQVIYLGLGYFLTDKTYLEISLAVIFASFGNAFGNFLLYYIFFFKNEALKLKITKYLNFEEDKIKNFLEKASKHSYLWVFLGKLTPSIKVFIPIIAAMLKIRPFYAFTIFLLGSITWGFALTFIGIYFGKNINLSTFFISVLLIYVLIFLIFQRKNAKIVNNN
jgi:membrane protein DedA with SNARE-associated domain